MQILGVGKRIDYRLEGLRNTSIGLSQVIQCLLRCSKKQRYRCTHRFVSLLNKYSQVRCVFPIALCLTLVSIKLVPWCLSALLSLSTNCVTYLASVNMYFIIFLFRFPLFPAIYMFHPLLLVSCFLGSERLISWIIHATWGLKLQRSFLSSCWRLCVAVHSLCARPHVLAMFQKDLVLQAMKIKRFIRRDWQLMGLKHVFSGY